MTFEEQEALVNAVFEDCLKTLRGKGQDYAGTADANANFKRNAERLGLTKYQVWHVYFAKHIDRISNAIKANPDCPTSQMESVRDSIKDGINYLFILAGLLEEDEQAGKKDPR